MNIKEGLAISYRVTKETGEWSILWYVPNSGDKFCAPDLSTEQFTLEDWQKKGWKIDQ